MSNTRHTVVIRRDLGMSAGLVGAQVSHIGDAFMREKIVKGRRKGLDENSLYFCSCCKQS
jgi:peptidyl-tRNA hydrolase